MDKGILRFMAEAYLLLHPGPGVESVSPPDKGPKAALRRRQPWPLDGQQGNQEVASRRRKRTRLKLTRLTTTEEDYPMENYISKVNYFCVGLGIGALAGILFAPKSGAETRDDVTRKVGRRQGVRSEPKSRELRGRPRGRRGER